MALNVSVHAYINLQRKRGRLLGSESFLFDDAEQLSVLN